MAETAEQKLLKMMETAAGGTETAAAADKIPADKKRNILSWVQLVNKILLGVVGICVIMFIFEVQSGVRLSLKRKSLSVASLKAKMFSDQDQLLFQFPLLDYYLDNVKQRNLFQPSEQKGPAAQIDPSANREILRKTAGFKLVGVAWLDTLESASVMIEDTTQSVTHFLKQGEKLGDITVKTIYADSAVLGYGNEEIEIRYDNSQDKSIN